MAHSTPFDRQKYDWQHMLGNGMIKTFCNFCVKNSHKIQVTLSFCDIVSCDVIAFLPLFWWAVYALKKIVCSMLMSWRCSVTSPDLGDDQSYYLFHSRNVYSWVFLSVHHSVCYHVMSSRVAVRFWAWSWNLVLGAGVVVWSPKLFNPGLRSY